MMIEEGNGRCLWLRPNDNFETKCYNRSKPHHFSPAPAGLNVGNIRRTTLYACPGVGKTKWNSRTDKQGMMIEEGNGRCLW